MGFLRTEAAICFACASEGLQKVGVDKVNNAFKEAGVDDEGHSR